MHNIRLDLWFSRYTNAFFCLNQLITQVNTFHTLPFCWLLVPANLPIQHVLIFVMLLILHPIHLFHPQDTSVLYPLSISFVIRTGLSVVKGLGGLHGEPRPPGLPGGRTGGAPERPLGVQPHVG